jgi:hypothetical protein
VIEDHSGTAVSGKTTAKPTFKLTASRQFTSWLAEQRASLAFTTYQAGKLFLIGLNPDGGLSVCFPDATGKWAVSRCIALPCLLQHPLQSGDRNAHELAEIQNRKLATARRCVSCIPSKSEKTPRLGNT